MFIKVLIGCLFSLLFIGFFALLIIFITNLCDHI